MSGGAADRGFTWSDEETALLLDLWSANDAQSELTGNKRNFPVYEKISESMNSMGYMRTASQCREKIKRMKREYSLSKQRHGSRFGPKKNMRFFEQFQKILLEKQNRSQRASNLKASSSVCGLDFETDENNCSAKRTAEKNKCKINTRSKSRQLSQKRNENSEKDDDNPWTPDILLIEGEETPDPIFENPGSPCLSVNGTGQKSCMMQENAPSEKVHNFLKTTGDLIENKEPTTSIEIPFLKNMMDSLTLKLMKYQTESDARILAKMDELENERTAMDERIQKMWLDFEEKRRNEEREHENNMLKVFQNIMNQMKVNNITET